MTDQTKAPLLTTSEAADAVNRAKAMMSHASIPILARAMDDLDELYLAYERILTSAPSTPPSSAPETTPKCNCYKYLYQVCDICQGVSHSPGTPAPAETPETREPTTVRCNCAHVPPTMPVYRSRHLVTCPANVTSFRIAVDQDAFYAAIKNAPDLDVPIGACPAPTGIAADPDATVTARNANEMILRRGWWLSHGCVGIYGDDGEMQCGSCMIDFKRDDPADIERKIFYRGAKAFAASQASPSIAATPDAPSKDTTARLLNIAEEIDLNEPWPEWRADRDYLRTLAARSVSRDAEK